MGTSGSPHCFSSQKAGASQTREERLKRLSWGTMVGPQETGSDVRRVLSEKGV